MPNVYLVRQDPSHLYGEYLLEAVVVAESVGGARKVLGDYIRQQERSNGEEIVWDAAAISICKVGNNGKTPGNCSSVLCMKLGENHFLPPGNYKEHLSGRSNG